MKIRSLLAFGGTSALALMLSTLGPAAAIAAGDPEPQFEQDARDTPQSRQSQPGRFRQPQRQAAPRDDSARDAQRETFRRALEERRDRQRQPARDAGVDEQRAQIDRRLREQGIDRDNPPVETGRNQSYVDPRRDSTYRDGRRDDRRDGRRDDREVGRDAHSDAVRDAIRRDYLRQQQEQRWREGRDGRDWRGSDRHWDGRDRGGWEGGDRHGRGWDRHRWRSDRRYDWHRWRAANRDVFRIGRYHAPYRWSRYDRLGVGVRLGTSFFGQRYVISDPWRYRLPDTYGPYRWVRYYDDVLLVDIYTGEVVDVIHDFFW